MTELTKQELLNLLFNQANEIANEVHAGWGNTMSLAAEHISNLCDELDKQQKIVDAAKDYFNAKEEKSFANTNDIPDHMLTMDVDEAEETLFEALKESPHD